MVTVDGDLVETTGMMTGGYRGNVTGFMGNDHEAELIEVEDKLKKYAAYSKDINETISILNEEILRDREEKARLTSLITELKSTIDKLKDRLAALMILDKIKARIEELSAKKSDFNQSSALQPVI
jgi:chromosome segregation ATPase